MAQDWNQPAYPQARRDDTVEDHHGTRVPDPYRWLEDLESEETRSWIEAENRLTRACLDRIPLCLTKPPLQPAWSM